MSATDEFAGFSAGLTSPISRAAAQGVSAVVLVRTPAMAAPAWSGMTRTAHTAVAGGRMELSALAEEAATG